jgi:hypothetical protein
MPALLVLLLLVLMIRLTPLTASAATLITYGTANGDSVGTKCDDCTNPITLSGYSWNFFGSTYSNLGLANNGLVSFGGAQVVSQPTALPASNIPMLAPFWSDADTRCAACGNTLWRAQHSGSALDTAQSIVRAHGGLAGSGFTATNVFVATWDHVGSYPEQTTTTNTFQLVLVSDSFFNRTFAIFNYTDGGINWLLGQASDRLPVAGYDKGDGFHYLELPGSRTTDIGTTLETQSNIGVAGQWLFKIDNVPVAVPAPAPVPAPASFALLGMGLAALGWARRRVSLRNGCRTSGRTL